MKGKFILIFVSLILACSSMDLQAQSSGSGTLEICFAGLRNSKGQITAGLSISDEGWPREPIMNLKWKKAGIKDGLMCVTVPGIPLGPVAISVLDDENSNGDIDMRLLIPKEGFGFSMNPKIGLSAPKFEECSFDFSRSGQRITIELNYVGKKE